MSAKFEMENPEKARFTLTVTLPLSEWKQVAKCLETNQGVVAYPLRQIIWDLTTEAERTWWKSGREASYQDSAGGSRAYDEVQR